jgi:hypothetical protein
MLGIVNETNTNRMNIIFIPMIYIVAYGIYTLATLCGLLISLLARKLSDASKSLSAYSTTNKAVIFAIILVYLVQFSSFSKFYFGNYSGMIGDYFRESFKDAIEYTVKENTPNKTVFVSNFTEAYVYILFYTRYDPREFYKTVKYVVPNAEFRPVSSFGNYRFISVDNEFVPRSNSYYIVENHFVGNFKGKDPISSKEFKKYTVLEF